MTANAAALGAINAAGRMIEEDRPGYELALALTDATPEELLSGALWLAARMTELAAVCLEEDPHELLAELARQITATEEDDRP